MLRFAPVLSLRPLRRVAPLLWGAFLLLAGAAGLQAQSTPPDGLPNVEPYRVRYYWTDPYQNLPAAGNALPNDERPRAEPGLKTEHPDVLPSLVMRLAEEADTTLLGYRVQIFLGKQADAARTKFEFIELFEDVPVYDVFEQPYYKVRVGDFRKRVSADRFLHEVQKHFPAAFVVPDRINPFAQP